MPSPYNKISLSLFGGSHESNVGLELDGLPVGNTIDLEKLREFTARRKSGRYAYSTPRREEDGFVFLSGMDNGRITGKIKAVIENTNIRPSDYGYSVTPRPSHADYVATVKYGSAPSGGGSFSGRMTAPLCIAGGIAEQLLSSRGIRVLAYISEIAGLGISTYDNGTPDPDIIEECHGYEFPVTERSRIPEIDARLREIQLSGDTAGGIIECVVYNAPIGLGGCLSDGLEGRLASALFSIPAVKGVESGLGRSISSLTGLKANDPFEIRDGRVVTATNNAGGINGGISNGMPITVRASFRPTPSVSAEQRTVNLETMENTVLKIKGRHDVAFLPRAVVAVESAVALVILDAMIENNLI